MELALPIIALGSLYVATNQRRKEGFGTLLPNTNLLDKNYPDDTIQQAPYDRTSELSATQSYDVPRSFVDKYFSQQQPMIGPNLAQTPPTYQSMTGQQVTADYFAHENMSPYFGGKIRGKTTDANCYESALDSYTGAGSQTIVKTEQSPMFEPLTNMQYANGSPNMTDFYQSRVPASNNMANSTAFQGEQVGPGVGLGFGNEGAGGYNNGVLGRELWQDKNVDELRVKSNPKSTEYNLLGYESAPSHFISNSTTAESMGNVNKNRPDTVFEMGSDRYLTTVGVEKAPPLQSKIIEKNVNRKDTSTSYTGIASKGVGGENIYTTGEYMPTRNQELGTKPLMLATATGKYDATDSDFGLKGVFAYPNNRSCNSNSGGKDYFGGVATSGIIGAVVAPLMDVFRPTKKDEFSSNMRMYGDAGTKVPESYMFNPVNNKPAPTNREMYESKTTPSQVNRNQDGGAYMVPTNPLQQTTRAKQNISYTGGGGSYLPGQTSYESGYNQRNNDNKSSMVAATGYTSGANMAVFNNYSGISHAPDDNLGKNQRAMASSRNTFQSPDAYALGTQSNSGRNTLPSDIQMQRNTSDILDAFKSNPFTHSLTMN